jgi:hypothetical protein
MPQCSFWLCFILMFLYLCKESWKIQWVLSVKGSLCSIDFVDWEKAWVGWLSAAVTTWGTTRTCHWVQLTIFLYRCHWWISSHSIPCGFYHPQSLKLLWSNNGSMFCCSVFDLSKDTSTECHVTSLPLMSGVALMAVGAQPMKTCLVWTDFSHNLFLYLWVFLPDLPSLECKQMDLFSAK